MRSDYNAQFIEHYHLEKDFDFHIMYCLMCEPFAIKLTKAEAEHIWFLPREGC